MNAISQYTGIKCYTEVCSKIFKNKLCTKFTNQINSQFTKQVVVITYLKPVHNSHSEKESAR